MTSALVIGLGLIVPVALGCTHREVQSLSLPVVGTSLPADLSGRGTEGVVLVAHGGYSTRGSWADEARFLAGEGFRVLVLETRGAVAFSTGQETDCLYDAKCIAADILAAVRYLRAEGARSVTVIGGSAGGGGGAEAGVEDPGAIDRLVLLAPMTIESPERITGRKLVVVARGDLGSGDRPRLPEVRALYDRISQPKAFLLLEGSAHGQRIFGTEQAATLRQAILAFLHGP